MGTMILKMSLSTLLYIALTAALKLWVHTEKTVLTLKKRVFIGVLYGLCAVLSTHFGILYEEMALNVRDIAPLAAGLFFDPVSGIIAGLIGGAERFIAGEFFGVSSYTRVACSVSTCLAGFFAAGINVFLFRGRKPSPFYAFSIGAVTEVFHMYMVFLTHRDDINFAFYVVNTCAKPMIIFTALGMFFISILLYAFDGKIKEALRRRSGSEIPISAKFQFWIFVFITLLFGSNFVFAYSLHTRTALQNARETMEINTRDAKDTYAYLQEDYKALQELIKQQTLIMTHAVESAVTYFGGFNGMPTEGLEKMRDTYNFYEINLIDKNGIVVKSSNPLTVGYDMHSAEQSAAFLGLLDGSMDEFAQDFMPIGRDSSISLMYVGVKTNDGMVQAALDQEEIDSYGSRAEYDEMFGNRHIGENGEIYVANKENKIVSGSGKGRTLDDIGIDTGKLTEGLRYFTAKIDGVDCYCRLEITKHSRFLTVLPLKEVYLDRNIAAYETAFAGILLLTLVFLLIYILVQKIVVSGLSRVNTSLGKITQGDLNEVVDVRSTMEFATLSDDINLTVDALKGHIEREKKRMEKELLLARQIQASALPQVFTFPLDEFRLFATMDPAKEVGGDFYDFFFIGQNKLALVIADVSGKGVPASLFMMRSKTAIKSLARLGRTPDEIFAKANDLLCEGNEMDMFVTAWIGIADLETGVLQCANAGHEYPAIKRKDGSWELFKDKHTIALAAMEGMRFKKYEMQLDEGDRLFVYTDGVPEAINGAEEQYGTDRMLDALNRAGDVPTEELLPYIRRDISDFAGDAEQFDDITMLGFDFLHKSKTGDKK